MIFIGGYARTGTTLIQGIICNDPATIAVTKESSYLRVLVSAYEYGKRIWDIHTDDYFDSPDDFRGFNIELLNKYFDHVRNRFGAGLGIVQKEPTMTLFFPELNELYPESLFVVMIRDPRDAVASQIKRHQKSMGAAFQRNTGNLLQDYIQRYARLCQNRQVFGKRLMFVGYESLIMDTETVLDDLRRFTGLTLPFDADKSSWDTKRTNSNESYSPLDGRPLSATSIGNYKNVLTGEEITAINGIEQKLTEMYGFSPFYHGANPSQ